MAAGSILGWINSDDLLEPGALGRVARVFEAELDVVLVAGCAALIDSEGALRGMIGTPLESTYDGLVRSEPNPAQPATFFRADAYHKVGGLDRAYDLAMDVDLWLRLARIGRVHYLPDEVLARFRVHETAKSVVGLTLAIREDFSIRRSHGLRLRSEAGLGFLRRGYVVPVLRPIKRRVVRAVRNLLIGG